MKKHLLIYCLIFVSQLGFAQALEIVQETWYLRSVMLDNTFKYLPYGEVIELKFNGNNPYYTIGTNGIMNTLTANAIFNTNKLKISEVEISSNQCNAPNCEYENTYFFEFLSNPNLDDKTFTYQYFDLPNEPKKFRLKDNNGNRADFLNHPLPAIDENVFKEWFLHSMDVDLGDPSYIEDFQPPIFPTLTINRDLTFSGKGACNDFSGRFEYTDYSNSERILIPRDFEATNFTCEFHSQFENYYFSQLRYGNPLFYFTWIDNEGKTYFTFEGEAYYFFNFADYPVLSTPTLEKNSLTIYPNPVANILSIRSSFNILYVSILDLNGRIVKRFEKLDATQIDVSDLESGMYFLTLQSSESNFTKKFVKN